ncbi:MAG: GTP cyclohydrolase I FolE, partial [Eudoraea sp.]|nr:GTP cyclohydrolase I FolE [Eudoraea sp.]
MNNQETLLNTLIDTENVLNGYTHEEIGDDHLYTGIDTPMKANAFDMSDEEKKENIAQLFAQIMDVMGLDL